MPRLATRDLTGYYGKNYSSDTESVRSVRTTRSSLRERPRLVDVKPNVLTRIKSFKNSVKQLFSHKETETVGIRERGFLDEVRNINRSIGDIKKVHVNDFRNNLSLHGNDEVLQMVCLESMTDELLRMRRAYRSSEDNTERSSISRQFRHLGNELINVSKLY
jgi:hypothetical protein